jgi:uncharacterized membrane protein YbhN (UPF0104 family)
MQLLKANWKRLLKLLGPLFFIFLILRVVDPKAAADAVRSIKLEFALISLLVFILVNAALALRWWVICQKLKMNVTYPKLFQIYYISWFLSLIPLAAITPVAKLAYLKDAGSPIFRNSAPARRRLSQADRVAPSTSTSACSKK